MLQLAATGSVPGVEHSIATVSFLLQHNNKQHDDPDVVPTFSKTEASQNCWDCAS